MPARLPRLRRVGARLELLAEGLRRHGREPDPARARGAAARLRRDAAPGLRRARARAEGRRVRRGSSSCACSSPARTSTAWSAAAGSSRPRPTAAWSGCCARPACRRACSSTAARCASSPRRAARAPAGSTSASRTWCRRRAGRSRTALRLLLGRAAAPRACRAQQRLAALLEDSRKYQNEVSERLAEQVLHALYELLRGFQAAARRVAGASCCASRSREHPDEVYRGAPHRHPAPRLPALRRGARTCCPRTRPSCATTRSPASTSACARTRRSIPDTMDQRYGAWAQLLVLFRMIHDGAESRRDAAARSATASSSTPTASRSSRAAPAAARARSHERIEPPLVPDGTVYRALEKLLVLDGERISYRALDVEQIGSVYETMMGFRLETATGRSVAIKAQKKQGAPDDGGPRGAARASPRRSARSGSRTAPTASSPTRSRRPWPRPRRSRTCTRRSCR